MKTFNKTLLVAALTLSGISFTASAATDGTLGTTSTGTSDVILVKENAVQITDVGDLDLGLASSLDADVSASDDVCVFNSTAAYTVNISSDNGAFELISGTDTIDYEVSWATTGAAAPVSYNTDVTGNLGDRTSPTCGGGTNATFEVTVAAADFNAALPGTYEDTLTLLITPE